MATSFPAGGMVTRGDLDIFLVDSVGSNPTNAAEIYYALFYVDPGPPEVEVLIGAAQRTPVNPQIGEYYAALQIPPSATLGTYRIRWYFREHISEPITQVVQVFTVIDPDAIQAVAYSVAQQQMMGKLRVLLRDQCVGGEEEIEVDADGERVVVRLDELWEMLHE